MLPLAVLPIGTRPDAFAAAQHDCKVGFLATWNVRQELCPYYLIVDRAIYDQFVVIYERLEST
jgi:hypothetical protein